MYGYKNSLNNKKIRINYQLYNDIFIVLFNQRAF